MIVDNRIVPDSVIKALIERVAQLSVGCLWLVDGQDIGEVFATEAEMREATAQVQNEMGVYRVVPRDAAASVDPKNDIWIDRGFLLCFARSAAGNPFCFDYSNGEAPAVVWWNNNGWEKLAESPAEFLELLTA